MTARTLAAAIVCLFLPNSLQAAGDHSDPVRASALGTNIELARPFFTDDDYPRRAIRIEEEGTVEFLALVSPQGRVVNTVLLSGSHWSLNRTAERLLTRRARFTLSGDFKGRYVWVRLPIFQFRIRRPANPEPLTDAMPGAFVITGTRPRIRIEEIPMI